LKGGGAGAGLLVLPILFIILYAQFVILPMYTTPAVTAAESGPAQALANQIKSMPLIDNQQCQGVSNAVANTITIMQDMNSRIGTGFSADQFDASNCDVGIGFLPVLGTYNSLILASKALDRNNQTSVKNFYEATFLLSSDFLLLNDKLIFKVAFRATGEINDSLKLAKLRSLCGDECYRAVLSGIHWTIRVNLNQSLCEFEDWAGKALLDKAYC